jgi:hypothetical protein
MYVNTHKNGPFDCCVRRFNYKLRICRSDGKITEKAARTIAPGRFILFLQSHNYDFYIARQNLLTPKS